MRTKRILGLLAAAMLSMMWAAPASAQATRTWISGVGDDANPCSRTAPCKTWAGAIAKTATFGEIDALDPGGFGAVTITKSITIDGGPGIAGVLVSGTNGIVVAVGSSDRVVLRNLQIDGLTTGLSGVLFNSSGQLVLEHDNIWGFTGIQESPGNPGSACVKFVPTGLSRLFIDDVHCQFNINGIDIAPTGGGGAGVEISKSYFQMNSNDGLRANATNGTVNVVVNDDVFTGNTNYGVEAFNGGLVAVTGSVITNSSTSGLNADSGGTVIAGGNTISRNNVGISASPGGSMQTFGDNYFVANVTNTAGTISSAGSKQ